MSLGRQLRRYAVELVAVLAIFGIALVVGGYILAHQRVRFPWEDVYTIKADFTNAQAVTPGQGQTVAVSGVVVGEIGRVELHDGVARVTMEINRDKLRAVHTDARMLLRPKTGLQDMSVQLDPGTPSAPTLGEDDVLPTARTQPNVNPDEFLAALDSDTRAWLRTLVSAGAIGLKDNGARLRSLFKAGAPTLRETRRVSDAILARRGQLARVVHNLRLISDTAAGRSDQLARLIGAANETFEALGRHDAALRESLSRLPGTLGAAREALSAARPFARELGPAAQELSPTIRKLTASFPELDPLLRDATPATARIRRLVARSKPVVRDLRPAVADLDAATPRLSGAFRVLERVTNELAYNPEGPEEGFLFWFAWFNHNAASMLSTEDANGASWRGVVVASCSELTAAAPEAVAAARLVLGLPTCAREGSGTGGH
jgi:phospholipid/cholesterol/gamma-HCH transport system substrate-binding protein